MRRILIASACVMALTGAAFAQGQPAPGASSSGNVGPGATAPNTQMDKARTGTTGVNNGMRSPGTQPSTAGDASNSGAPTAAGPNSTGSRAEPGAVKNGANSR
jgi:hypothetical protein